MAHQPQFAVVNRGGDQQAGARQHADDACRMADAAAIVPDFELDLIPDQNIERLLSHKCLVVCTTQAAPFASAGGTAVDLLCCRIKKRTIVARFLAPGKGKFMPTCDRGALRWRLLLLVLAGLSGPAIAADSDSESAPPTATTPATALPRVDVEGKPWLYNRQTRYAHSMPEVDGTEITVTKKASVEKLDDQPTVIDNNQRALLARLPGLVIAEQQNPTQLNLSYRGLGNPQESEYTLSLQDGIPIVSDWIGFPTLYYLPVPQSLQAVQMIRGGLDDLTHVILVGGEDVAEAGAGVSDWAALVDRAAPFLQP